MRGRKAKPIEQKVREGNPGNRPLPLALRTGPTPGRIPPPKGMPPEAVELWGELVARLDAAGILDRVDTPALQAMCIQWARAARAGAAIAEDGMVALGSMGQVIEHPLLAVERNAFTLFLRFAEQYGLTPAARARIAAALQGRRDDDELAAIIDAEPAELAE